MASNDGPSNGEIADAFDELATLYELDGANRYRVLAYREASRVIRDAPVGVADLAAAGRATELPGIGATLQEKIRALADEGAIPSALKLKARIPEGLVAVTGLPGIGAKTVRKLHEELGIESLTDLERAAKQGRVRSVKGMGAKAEERVLEALERRAAGETEGERRLLSETLAIAGALAESLRESPGCERAEVAGSARRHVELCKDIDIAAAGDPGELAAALAEHDLIAEAGEAAIGGSRARTHNGITVELRVGPAESFGNLLQHLTGSAEHNVALRERAVARGMSVSEHGIETETGLLRDAEEAGVYEALELPWIPPELREGRGEIEAAEQGTLPELVRREDLRGELHCHTTLSDGKATLEQMVEAGMSLGYGYMAITDHSASHGFGDHVTPEALAERVVEVRALDRKLKGFKLLAGSEVNIQTDGTPDYPDAILAELDWVLASVHTSFQMTREEMTDRVVRAIEHPLVDCIGHLTGRMMPRRDPYEIDVERVVNAAAANGTMLEINGNPRRRDLNERHARLAAEAGVPVVITSDAHQTATLANVAYGAATARRGWLTAAEVANTRAWRSFSRLRKRTRAA